MSIFFQETTINDHYSDYALELLVSGLTTEQLSEPPGAYPIDSSSDISYDSSSDIDEYIPLDADLEDLTFWDDLPLYETTASNHYRNSGEYPATPLIEQEEKPKCESDSKQ